MVKIRLGNFAMFILFCAVLLTSCRGGDTRSVVLSSSKSITAFSFTSPAAAGVIDQNAKTILVNVPYGTDVADLVAMFTTTGARVNVGTTEQIRGITPNDFHNPVDYIVTAEDNSTARYTVTVTVAPNDAKAITAFSFTSPAAVGIINEGAKTIAVTVPHGTDVTALVAAFTTNGVSVEVGSTPQVSGTTPNNFTNPRIYVISAEDGSTETYTVIVKTSIINLAKTGQTTSYAAGDDGALQKGAAWPAQRFTDNTDGTITDNLTGLVWLKDADCAYTYNYNTDFNLYIDGHFIWQAALDLVAGINTGTFPNCAGGHNDWRLPNVNELESLVNGGPSNLPSWLNSQGFSNTQSEGYWSSTTAIIQSFPSYPPAVSYVYMYGGGIGGYGVTYGFYAWPVRGGQADVPAAVPKTGQTACYDNGASIGGSIISCATTSAQGQDGALQEGVAWPDPRFSDNSDGTITDNLTGLMWLKDANCITNYASYDNDGTAGDGAVTWQHALDFVAGINSGTYSNCARGYTDWRLPNRIELRSLADYSKNNPALPTGHPFANVQSYYYWTSSTCAFNASWAWYVYMPAGSGLYSDKANSYYVWPVRAGQ